MPKQVAQSGLLSKLGSRLVQAFEKHKHDDTEYGQVELPAGIEGGIAQLVMCKFDTFKTGDSAGEPFFMASGVVIEPVTFKDSQGRTHRTQGQRTSIGPEPLCDTPKRQSRPKLEDHLAWILNELRKLGVPTGSINLNDLEVICAGLCDKDNPVYFKFRTWKGAATEEYPNPRTNHQWIGAVDASEIEGLGDETSGVEEDTIPPPPVKPTVKPGASTNGKPAATNMSTSPSPAPRPATKTPTPMPTKPPVKTPTPPPPPAKDEYTDQGDLDSLAELADGGDEEAKATLTEMATSMGYTEEQVESADTWTALVEAMKAGGPEESEPVAADQEAAEQEEAATEEEWAPQIDEIYLYKPLGPNKKPVAKAIECEVLAVNETAKTVDLKNMNNPKLKYSKVAWDALERNG